jgi:hypothetical protein
MVEVNTVMKAKHKQAPKAKAAVRAVVKDSPLVKKIKTKKARVGVIGNGLCGACLW